MTRPERKSVTSCDARPATVAELWDQCWVANSEAEAVAQAEHMYDLFKGRRVAVDRLEVWDEGEFWGDGEVMFREPWPEVWVDMLSTERGWDGDTLYPEWYVRVADPEQVVTTADGRSLRMGDLTGTLTTTAPGVGTAEGFGHREGAVMVLPCGQPTDHHLVICQRLEQPPRCAFPPDDDPGGFA